MYLMMTLKGDLTQYNDPLWAVILYYFLGVCIFECIPPQTCEILLLKEFHNILHIMLEYNLGKILIKQSFKKI